MAQKLETFGTFLTAHPVLAAGAGLGAGALGAYAAHAGAGLDAQTSLLVGAASGLLGVVGASYAYLDRPALVQYHPYVATFVFLGATAAGTAILAGESGGLINLPTATVLGSIGGVFVVGVACWVYDWLTSGSGLVKKAGQYGFLGLFGWLWYNKDDIGQKVGVPVGNTVEKVEDAIGLNGKHIDLDDVLKHGTPEEKALAKQIVQLMRMGNFDADKEAQIQKLLQQLAGLMAHPDAPDATDASFTTNNDNPAPSAFAPRTGMSKVAVYAQPEGIDIDDSDVEDRWPLYHPSETVLA